MKRFGLLLEMLLFAVLICCAVALGSPYAPVVQPAVDIEEIWAIEDAREESDEPLVTALRNRDVPLAYDEEMNTFFCTLGMENGDQWPDIHLYADGQPGMSVVFVDDYNYDWCCDAIRDGYSYELMAYTDTQYSYFNIVFTSLPIVMLDSERKIPAHEDVPVEVVMSWDDETVMTTHGRAHKRGDTSLRKYDKNGLKVEFTQLENGTHKIDVDTPFLGMTGGMILLACAVDHQMIRDRLSWDMYSGITEESEPFGAMKAHYVELFVNQAYQGAYLMMKPYSYQTEMAKLDPQAPAKDSYYRVVGRSTFEFDRPWLQDHRKIYYEQHYAPADMEPFDSLRPYLDLIKEPNNEKFSEMVLKYLDIDSVIRYMLYVHACGLTDNDVNNINIWAHYGRDGLKYYFNPWDLDVSWGLDDEENAEAMYAIELFDRMVGLDCGGIVRSRVKAIWQEFREKAFNQAYLDKLVAQYERELNESCAYYRDTVKWEKSTSSLDMYNIYSYALARMDMMDRRIEQITSEEMADRYVRIDEYGVVDEGPLDVIRGQDIQISNTVM
ncbi:MAG: hypothetical protein E7321_07145 [Clostridiales bacterium]|nr:hypothetical protein [Clostridiales bacterium]